MPKCPSKLSILALPYPFIAGYTGSFNVSNSHSPIHIPNLLNPMVASARDSDLSDYLGASQTKKQTYVVH
jgi:hypothetical protein